MADRCYIRVFINRAVVRVSEEQEAGAEKPKTCVGVGGVSGEDLGWLRWPGGGAAVEGQQCASMWKAEKACSRNALAEGETTQHPHNLSVLLAS